MVYTALYTVHFHYNDDTFWHFSRLYIRKKYRERQILDQVGVRNNRRIFKTVPEQVKYKKKAEIISTSLEKVKSTNHFICIHSILFMHTIRKMGAILFLVSASPNVCDFMRNTHLSNGTLPVGCFIIIDLCIK